MRDPLESSHRRLDLLTGDYVLVSPHRNRRPWQGAVEDISVVELPQYDPDCYLCPGNRRAGNEQNPNYRKTFVFNNDFAALQPRDNTVISTGSKLLVAATEQGRCQVVCFSPRHDQTLADLSVDQISKVISTWRDEYISLGDDPTINHVQIFENKGEAMGCSNPHPHGQIWAQSSIPNKPRKELARMQDYFERNVSPLLIDYVNLEIERNERVIACNAQFAAVVPFWATWPFEALVVPRRQIESLKDMDTKDITGLAEILQTLTRAYDRLFDVSFPYSAGIHQAPTDGQDYAHCTLHMHFYPPLLRSAKIKKFMVGYEMTGEAQRDLTPEMAAKRLRDCLV